MKKIGGILCFLLMACTVHAKSLKVHNTEEYKSAVKQLLPGDSLVLAKGVWKDADLTLAASGQPDKFIYLTVEEQGEVSLEGKSCLRFSGEYLHISGLIFRNGSTPRGYVIEFKTASDKWASRCILSNCVIDQYNQAAKSQKDGWVSIWGQHNRIEYCYFGGKNNQGTTLIVWPNGAGHTENYHHIYRNYFGPRPPLGANGGETIRIGTSQFHRESSNTIVEENYFERCNGEVEIISVKSCGNRIVNNTFFECEGTMTLRHGNNNEVSGNFFYGNNKRNTGGVRIINQGHRVFNNFFYQLAGTDFRAPLVIMNGIQDTPDNGYLQVKDVVVSNNTFVECSTPFELCVGAGERDRTMVPETTVIENNVVYCPEQSVFVKSYDKTDGITLRNNVFAGVNGISQEAGCVVDSPLLVKAGRFNIVYSEKTQPRSEYILTDILRKDRPDSSPIGAFLAVSPKEKFNFALRTTSGPRWYTPAQKESKIVVARVVKVEPGIDSLYHAIRKAKSGDVLILSEGTYVNTKKATVTGNIRIIAGENARTRPVVRMDMPAETVTMFELRPGCHLRLDGIELDGGASQKNPAKYAFSTTKESGDAYTLLIDNCEIHSFQNQNGGSVLKAYKGTFADSIVVRNSIIRDAYRGFALNEEKDDKGAYNAEYVVFDNTLFSRITQWALDYYRGGIDDSTLGGNLFVDHCVFDAVNDNATQTVIRQTGIKSIRINNTIFSNSEAKNPIRLIGKDNNMTHCNVYYCGKPSAMQGATLGVILTENPKFEKKTFRLSKNSPLVNKGNDGKNIGLIAIP